MCHSKLVFAFLTLVVLLEGPANWPPETKYFAENRPISTSGSQAVRILSWTLLSPKPGCVSVPRQALWSHVRVVLVIVIIIVEDPLPCQNNTPQTIAPVWRFEEKLGILMRFTTILILFPWLWVDISFIEQAWTKCTTMILMSCLFLAIWHLTHLVSMCNWNVQILREFNPFKVNWFSHFAPEDSAEVIRRKLRERDWSHCQFFPFALALVSET